MSAELPPLPLSSPRAFPEEFSILLKRWLLLNQWEAVADLVKRWLSWALSLMFLGIAIPYVPVVWLLPIAVVLVLICISLDRVLRPGSLYAVHRKAADAIRQLDAELQARIMATSQGSGREQAHIILEISQRTRELSEAIFNAECEADGLLGFWSWTPTPPMVCEEDLRPSSDGTGAEMIRQELVRLKHFADDLGKRP